MCPQFDILYDHLTAREHLRLYGRLHGVPESSLESRITKLLDLVSLSDHADNISLYYSGGTRRKLSLAIAFVGNPKICFLDEPTGSMDPVSRQSIWNLIRRMKKRSKTAIILVTHQLNEAEALSNRIGILVEGRLKAIGTVEHLKEKYVSGYDVIIKSQAHLQSEIKLYLAQYYSSVLCRKEFRGYMYFKINESLISLSHLFEIIEARKKEFMIEDYTVSKGIFMHFNFKLFSFI